MTTTTCPCQSGKNFDDCCGPFLEGKSKAKTAEQLMRARYSAYATGKVEYVQQSQIEHRGDSFDLEEAKRWSKESSWLGLEVKTVIRGEASDEDGVVEFVAKYKDKQGTAHDHHEIASFKKEGGEWKFDNGRLAHLSPYVRETPKQGRNDQCACGSGKKFKKCCGA